MTEIIINTLIGVFFLLVTYSIVRKITKAQEHMYKKLADALQEILNFAVKDVEPLRAKVETTEEDNTKAPEVVGRDTEAVDEEFEKVPPVDPNRINPEDITLEKLRGITFNRKIHNCVAVFPVLHKDYPVSVTLPQELVTALDKHFGYDISGSYEILITLDELESVLKSYKIQFITDDELISKSFDKAKNRPMPKLKDLTEDNLADIFVEPERNRIKKTLRYIKDGQIIEKVTYNAAMYEQYQKDWGLDINSPFHGQLSTIFPTEDQFLQWYQNASKANSEEMFTLFDDK